MGRTGRSAIGTLVVWKSRYVLLIELPEGKTAPHFCQPLSERLCTLVEQLRRTLICYHAKEMAEHVQFTIETGTRSTSAIRGVPGSEAATRTQSGSYASICLAR